MKLADWLDKHNLSQIEFARQMELSAAAVSLYVAGKRHPRPSVIRRIMDITEGAVRPQDWYEI